MKRLVLVLSVLVSGCVTDVARFSVATSKNVEISRLDLGKAQMRRGCRGGDGRLWLLFIPLGSAPTIQRSMDEMLNSGWGDVAFNVDVQSVGWTIGLVSWESYRVMGDVADTMGPGARQLEGTSAAVTSGRP